MKKLSNIIYYLICVYIVVLPVISNKLGVISKIPDILLISIILIYGIYKISGKSRRESLIYSLKDFVTSFVGIGMILLSILMIGSTVYATEKALALKESFRFITYIGLVFIVKYEIKETYKIKNIMKCIVWVTAFLAMFGIIQYFTKLGLDPIFVSIEGTRITATMENPNGFGAYLVLIFFPIFMLSLNDMSRVKKIGYISLSLIILINIFLTYSRNATVGFFIGILVLAILYNYKILSVFFVAIPIFLMDTSLIHRFSNVKISILNDPRIKLWKVAIQMIKENPILGVGNGNYVALYDLYIEKYPHLAYKDYHRFSSHNSYLKVQSELGILGIITFIFMIVGSIRTVVKVYRNTSDKMYKLFFMGVMASLVAFLAMNLLDNLFFSPQTTTYFWVFIALGESILFNEIFNYE